MDIVDGISFLDFNYWDEDEYAFVMLSGLW